MEIIIEFNNGTDCIFDNVVDCELNGKSLNIRFKNKCVRCFNIDNIKKLEKINNGQVLY